MILNALTVVRFAAAFVTLVRDPQRLDAVFKISDATDDPPRIRAMLERDERIVEVAHAPLMPALPPLRELRGFPAGTLGRAYADFMDRDGLAPEVLDRNHPDTEEGRVRRHLELSHDLWHVVTGFGPDLRGELGLQAFYVAQFPAFLALPAIAAGLLHVLLYDPEAYLGIMDAISEGWRRGRRAERLIGVDWQSRLARPLAAVREELGVEPVQSSTRVPSASSVQVRQGPSGSSKSGQPSGRSQNVPMRTVPSST